MDALKIEQATLVGNSMGAGLAIGMALAHPNRVSNLILIDGLPANVWEKLTSPSIKRALDSSAPTWLVSLGNWLFGGVMIESVLKEIVHDPSCSLLQSLSGPTATASGPASCDLS